MKLTPLTFPSFCEIFYCRKRSPKTKDEPFAFVVSPLPEQNKVVTKEIAIASKDIRKLANDTLDTVVSVPQAAAATTTAASVATDNVVKETDNKIPKVELQNPIIAQSGAQHAPPPPITIVNKDDFQFAEPQTVRTVR